MNLIVILMSLKLFHQPSIFHSSLSPTPLVTVTTPVKLSALFFSMLHFRQRWTSLYVGKGHCKTLRLNLTSVSHAHLHESCRVRSRRTWHRPVEAPGSVV